MEKKVKWQRVDGQLMPFMFEEVNGRWLWVGYQSSKAYVPDRGHSFSRGYLSFLNALKMGYTSVRHNP